MRLSLASSLLAFPVAVLGLLLALWPWASGWLVCSAPLLIVIGWTVGRRAFRAARAEGGRGWAALLALATNALCALLVTALTVASVAVTAVAHLAPPPTTSRSFGSDTYERSWLDDGDSGTGTWTGRTTVTLVAVLVAIGVCAVIPACREAVGMSDIDSTPDADPPLGPPDGGVPDAGAAQ